tara:strand:- start:356 stop:790 length:435 start_codon:yes stop_codon:yes gene_type:complete
MRRKQPKFEFTASGFVIALVLVSMFASVFAVFGTQLDNEYTLNSTYGFDKYDQKDLLLNHTSDIQNATDINLEPSFLDIIGGYFKAGYKAIKISVNSFSLFDSMIDDAAEDIPSFALFKSYLITLMIAIIFIGVIISALLKMRV